MIYSISATPMSKRVWMAWATVLGLGILAAAGAVAAEYSGGSGIEGDSYQIATAVATTAVGNNNSSAKDAFSTSSASQVNISKDFHVPLPDSESCPPTVDDYGTPINWTFAPLPLLNIMVLGGPVNFTPIEGQMDFCAYSDIVFCSLEPIATILPELQESTSLFPCLTMDINGPVIMTPEGEEEPLSPNGILDAAYELGILAEMYDQGNTDVITTYQTNFQAIKDSIVDDLVAAELKSDKDLRGLVQSAAPYLVSALSSVTAGLATLGDETTNAAVDQMLLSFESLGIGPPEGGIASITSGLSYLGPDGDADGGGASNRQEYEFYVIGSGFSPEQYVAAALDPDSEPEPLEEGEGEGEGECEGENEGFVCPEDAVASQPGTAPGTLGYTPDYTLIEFDLLINEQASLILDKFVLIEETTICSMTWWGVEVDAAGIDCTTTDKTFSVAIVNQDDWFGAPEYVDEITVAKTAVGSATMKGQEVTIYRYHADILTNCPTLPAGEHFISVVGLDSGTTGCSFGWMNTVSGDDTYFGVGENGPFPLAGNLAFCLSLGNIPAEGEGEGEGELPEGEGEGEGELPEGEGEGERYSGGTGIEGDPYQIATVTDWTTLSETSDDWNKHFLLTQDIDFEGASLTPVGTFTGLFDGDNHILRNGKINTHDYYVGIFGYVGAQGRITNLGVEAITISSSNESGGYVGGLVGTNSGAIEHCYVIGTVAGGELWISWGWYYSVGGLVGENYGTISQCHVSGTVMGGNISGVAEGFGGTHISYFIGGLVGINSGSVSRCHTSASVTGGDISVTSASENDAYFYHVGGLMGENSETISESYATGTVTGGDVILYGFSCYAGSNAGGLVGSNQDTVSQCYASGAVTGHSNAGGLVGTGGTITASYATGAVHSSDNAGGLVGTEGTITACYAMGAVTSANNTAGGLRGSGYLGNVAAACFWDMESSGRSGSEVGGKGLTSSQMGTISYFQNAGWSAHPWVMTEGSAPRLAWEDLNWPAVPEAEPVPLTGSGTEGDPFLITTAADFAVLSMYTEVLDKHLLLTQDVDLASVTLYPIGDLGAFTGIFDGGGHVVRNGQLNFPEHDCIGLFGYLGETGILRNLGVEGGSVTGKDLIGGLVGFCFGDITACYCSSTVNGSWAIGGLVGFCWGDITACYSTGTITGVWSTGGLVGYHWSERDITACYATGVVVGTGDSIGGLLGSGGGVTTSFWDTESSGQTVSQR